MCNLLKLLHLLGLAAFLGSILAFIVASRVAEGLSVQRLAALRSFVDAGTLALTLPGMWVVAATGLAGALLRGGLFRDGWLIAKQGLMFLVLVNAHLVVAPAVFKATRLAAEAATSGTLPAAYHGAFLLESSAGGVNIVLILAAGVLGIWKPGRRSIAPQRHAPGRA